MRRVLFVAEKNDVAKGVARILGKGDAPHREGRSKFNKIYQVQTNLLGQQCHIAVTSVSGHLMSWEFGPEMKDWHRVPLVQLFEAPVYQNVTVGFKDIATTLRDEAKKAEILVIWTDCDREGENIGAEIVKVCHIANRHLDVYRAKFSEITPAAIETAARNLIRLDNRIVDAVDCRSELDLRIGAAFTRLQTIHLQKNFSQVFNSADGRKQVISYGSCQFPTLGFVVERYKSIEQFIPEKFWKLSVEHIRDGKKAEFLWDRQRLFDRDIVNVLYDDCNEAKIAKIQSVTKKPKSKYRPYALDTVEMEKLGVRKLKLSAKTVMSIAEKLYSTGWISYPRTETNKFPADINLRQLVTQQEASGQWGEFAAQISEIGPNPRNGNKSDEAHPPIHPLKYANQSNLSGDEWRVYELIVRHFLACVSWDGKGQETKIEMKIGGEFFHATGLQIDDLGYMNVYVYDKWSDKTVPKYVENESITDHKLKMDDGQTQPPQLLNEADLISLMDKFGIGTDATHAEHIEKIKEREYVGVRDDGRFLPGFLGLALVDGYDDMGFAMSKPQLRADLERQLQAICNGQRTKRDVLDEQIGKYRRILEHTDVELLSQAFRRYLNSNPHANRNLSLTGGGNGRGGGPVNNVPPASANSRGRGRGRGRGAAASTSATRNTSRQNGTDDNTAARNGRGRGRTDVPTTADQDNTDGLPCRCGIAAVQRTVVKEGPNKGKKFWCCSKAMGAPDKCDYFEWA